MSRGPNIVKLDPIAMMRMIEPMLTVNLKGETIFGKGGIGLRWSTGETMTIVITEIPGKAHRVLLVTPPNDESIATIDRVMSGEDKFLFMLPVCGGFVLEYRADRHYRGTERTDIPQITSAFLPEEMRGHGIMKRIYEAVACALPEGFYSDWQITKDAKRVWTSLKKVDTVQVTTEGDHYRIECVYHE